jgi:hypothetical protein
MVDQDLPHGRCRDRQEVSPITNIERGAACHPDVGLVDQCGGVERVARALTALRS